MDSVILRGFIFLLGAVLAGSTILSAVRTFVVPRAEFVFLTRAVFGVTRFFFDLWRKRARTYSERDRIMVYYAPISVLALLPAWLMLVALGYMAMFWAIGAPSAREAFRLSGSSLFTLGTTAANDWPSTLLIDTEAMVGLLLVALLIAYLPTMYSAFSRREAAVTMLEVRAGDPPSAVTFIERFHRIQGFDRMGEMWQAWEAWFADIEESHTSLGALAFFRSPQPNRSWVTAAGAVLDAASLVRSTLDLPLDPRADLCIRSGYLALRHIADYFNVEYDPNPKPSDPISISQKEFDEVYDRFEGEGIPLKADRDQAWRDFAGWRVNYDEALVALAAITMAPPAPWSSDRANHRYIK